MHNHTHAVMPCPFCGSQDVSNGEILTEMDGKTFVQSECQGCGAAGPRAMVDGPDYGASKAIAAWNKRPNRNEGGG